MPDFPRWLLPDTEEALKHLTAKPAARSVEHMVMSAREREVGPRLGRLSGVKIDGVLYPSFEAAAEALNVERPTIRAWIHSGHAEEVDRKPPRVRKR